MARIIELDALIVGAGFGGVYQLKRLKDEGFDVKLVECGTDFGGVWQVPQQYWNRYPGARVDSTIPHYEFSDPNLWTDWTWSERFPGSSELRKYFRYVVDQWGLRKDAIFSTLVNSAIGDEKEQMWNIGTNADLSFKCRFFLPNTGFAAKRHIPDWPGIDEFEGIFLHPSYWPKLEPDVKGKKVAVIGTGSTGIQIVQDLAPLASELTLFMRTPNLALPMGQVQYNGKRQAIPKENYHSLFAGRTTSYGGFDFSFAPKNTFDDSDVERKKFYQELWAHGDFHFWLATYQDMLFDDKSNTEAYNFWRDKVRARIADPKLAEKFAPAIKPHAFGCKRVSLENEFYELFNEESVHLVDQHETPIECFTPRGIKTKEKEWDFDIIVCATGFDAITGGILQMNLVGKDGVTLQQKWADGLKTQLGMCVSGFPNMFFTYGPQAPTALCNGPSCAEIQGKWIVKALKTIREKHLTSIDATLESEAAWAKGVSDIANMSLLPSTKSWYMGDNIPGKRREPLLFLGGVPTYHKMIHDAQLNNYEGFVLA